MSNFLTYSEWSIKLELFLAGNDDVLNDLKDAQFELDSGTASIFYKKLETVYDFQKKKWLDKFNKSIVDSNPKSDGELEFIFRNARSNLNALISFIKLNGIPEKLKNVFKNDLIQFITDIKQNMKEDIMKNNYANERIILIINNFNLSEKEFENKSEKSETNNNTSTRKIIF